MSARYDTKIILTMNPEQLRSLADKMERAWEKTRIGENCFVDTLSHKDPIIHLYFDQEYFHKLEDKKKS